jgi:hypothetical protein
MSDLSEKLKDQTSIIKSNDFDIGVLARSSNDLLEDNNISASDQLSLEQAVTKALVLLQTREAERLLKNSNNPSCEIKNILLRYNVARMENNEDNLSSLLQEMKIAIDKIVEALSSNALRFRDTEVLEFCHEFADDCFPFPRFFTLNNSKWIGEIGSSAENQNTALIESIIALIIKLKSVGMDFQEEEKGWHEKLFSMGLSFIKNDFRSDFQERLIEIMKYLSDTLKISDSTVEEEYAKLTTKKDKQINHEAELLKAKKKVEKDPKSTERDYQNSMSFYPQFDRVRRICFDFEYGRIEELKQGLLELAIELETEADKLSDSLELRAKNVKAEDSRDLVNECIDAYLFCAHYYNIIDNLSEDEEFICRLTFSQNHDKEIKLGDNKTIQCVSISLDGHSGHEMSDFKLPTTENSRRYIKKIADLNLRCGRMKSFLGYLRYLGEVDVDVERKILSQLLVQALIAHDFSEALNLAQQLGGDPHLIQKIIFKLTEKLYDENATADRIFSVLNLVKMVRHYNLGDLEKPTIQKILINFSQFLATRHPLALQSVLLMSNGSASHNGTEESCLIKELISNDLAGCALELFSTMILKTARLTEPSVISIANKIKLKVGNLLEANNPLQEVLEQHRDNEVDIENILAQSEGSIFPLLDKKEKQS